MDDAPDAAAPNQLTLDAGIGRPTHYETTLVPGSSNDASVFVSVPHSVSLLDVNGNPLVPPVEVTSGAQGQISFDLPADAVSIYVVGVGPDDNDSSTYDTVSLNTEWSVPDSLLHISSRSGLHAAAETSDYTPRSDRAAMAAVIYWTLNRERRARVGCAEAFIDAARGPDEDQAQRYVNDRGVLSPLSEQAKTSRRGIVYFGNMKIGLHTLHVSFDDGQSIAARTEFTVSRPRSGARSPIKAILYQLNVELEAPADPTPASCAR